MRDAYAEQELEYLWLLGDIPVDIEDFVKEKVRKAAELRMNAAYSGSHTDGGAGIILEYLKGYLQGYRVGKTIAFSIV